METELQIIVTEDGSHSLLNKALNETYHSNHGALQESLHVFIKHGLDFFLTKRPSVEISIFEVGFGTGLNALLAMRFARQHPQIKFHYQTIEAHPLPESICCELNYAGEDEKQLFLSLHQLPWNASHLLIPNFTFIKHQAYLEHFNLEPAACDVVFYDAFAPSKQPEMWSLDNLKNVTAALCPGGVFVTYCAKGQLKRDLKTLGLSVETLTGPPGKKEMTRGVQN